MAILAGMLLNGSDVKELRSEMRQQFKEHRTDVQDLRTEMSSRFNEVDAQLRYFQGFVGKLDGRIEAIEKR